MAKMWNYINLFFVKIILGFLNLYKFLRKPFPKTCRFYPSCSEYFQLAVLKYGFLKGSFLGLIRILKCHPFHPGGHDSI